MILGQKASTRSVRPRIMDTVDIIKHDFPSDLAWKHRIDAHSRESLPLGEVNKARVPSKGIGEQCWDLTRRVKAYVRTQEIKHTDFRALLSLESRSTSLQSASSPPNITAGTSAPSISQSSLNSVSGVMNQEDKNEQSHDAGSLDAASAGELLTGIGAQYDCDLIPDTSLNDLDHKSPLAATEVLLQGYKPPLTWAYSRLSDLAAKAILAIVKATGGSDSSSSTNTTTKTIRDAGQSAGYTQARISKGKQSHRDQDGDDTRSTSTRRSKKEKKKEKKMGKEKEKVYDKGDALMDFVQELVTCPLSDLESPKVWCADRTGYNVRQLKNHVKSYHSDLMCEDARKRVNHQGGRLSKLNVRMRIEGELLSAISVRLGMTTERNAAYVVGTTISQTHPSDIMYECMKTEMMSALHDDLNSLRDHAHRFLRAWRQTPASYTQIPAQPVGDGTLSTRTDWAASAYWGQSSAFYMGLFAGTSTHQDSGYSTQSIYNCSMPGNELEEASYCFNLHSPPEIRSPDALQYYSFSSSQEHHQGVH